MSAEATDLASKRRQRQLLANCGRTRPLATEILGLRDQRRMSEFQPRQFSPTRAGEPAGPSRGQGALQDPAGAGSPTFSRHAFHFPRQPEFPTQWNRWDGHRPYCESQATSEKRIVGPKGVERPTCQDGRPRQSSEAKWKKDLPIARATTLAGPTVPLWLEGHTCAARGGTESGSSRAEILILDLVSIACLKVEREFVME